MTLVSVSFSYGQQPSWTHVTPTGGGPLTYNQGTSSIAYDSVNDRLIVFGGSDPSRCCNETNDTWVLVNASGPTPMWQQLTPSAPAGLPPGRIGHSAAYDAVTNRLIIFAGGRTNGFAYSPLFNDVWVLTNANGLGGTPQWVPRTPSGGPPAPREGHGAFYKQASNEMIVFGGANNGIMSVPGDLWALQNANSIDPNNQPIWVPLGQSGALPGPIEHFASAFNPASNAWTIALGCCGYTNAVRTLTLNRLSATPQWAGLSPTGTPPPGGDAQNYFYDQASDSLYIQTNGPGGWSTATWALTGATGPAPNWRNVIPQGAAGTPPLVANIIGSAYNAVSKKFIVPLTHTDNLGNVVPEVWVLALNTAASSTTWAQLSPSGGPPPQRKFHSSAYDRLNNRLIIFAGCAAQTCQQGQPTLNDVWVLTDADGSTGPSSWIQLNPTGGPPPARHSHVATYDPTTNTMVIWSGDSLFYSVTDLSDVWILTNANGLNRATGQPAVSQWIQLFLTGATPAHQSSPGREASAGIYDPISNRMIIFGGDSCDPCRGYNDVWALTNANGSGGTPQWIQLLPSGTPPSPRTEHNLVYDGANDRMILFGGDDPTFGVLQNDTWVLSNASGIDRATGLPATPHWMQLSTAGGPPPARGFHAAAYDSVTNRMIIFGGGSFPGVGATGSPSFNDAWVLSNANGIGTQTPTWSQFALAGTAPSARIVFGNQDLYNPATSSLIVYGGTSDLSSGAAAYQDSWVLNNALGPNLGRTNVLYSQINGSLTTDPYTVGNNFGQTGQNLGSGLTGTLTDFQIYLVNPPVGQISWILAGSTCIGCTAQVLAQPTIQSNGLSGVYDFVLQTPIVLDPSVFYVLNSPATGPGPISFACDATASGHLPANLGHLFGGTCAGSLGFNQTGFMYFTLNGFNSPPPVGTITVSANTPLASYTISGPETFSGGGTSATISNAPVGAYTITFAPVSGYLTPATQNALLAAGQTLTFNGQYVAITLKVCPTASSVCAPTLSFSYQQGATTTSQAQRISISSNGSGIAFSASTTTNAADGPWLTIAPSGGLTPATMTVVVSSKLKFGVYSGVVSITSPNVTNSPQTLTVMLSVTKGVPPPTPIPGLQFPVKADDVHCTGPQGGCGPSTANISAIFDHQMVYAYESNKTVKCSTAQSAFPTYGKIVDFQGEELDGPAAGGAAIASSDAYGKYGNLCGYSSPAATPVLVGYNLQQPSWLYYDGHPGYDYPFAFGTALFPAISGCVTYQSVAAGALTQKQYHVLTIIPKLNRPNGCAGATSDTGYTVAYVHLSSLVADDGSVQRCLAPNDNTCVACPECPKEGEWVDASRTAPIAYTGNFSAGSWGGPSGKLQPHLHFETDEWRNGSPVPIDPYGWQPKVAGQKDPYSVLQKGILNQVLWNP